MKKIPNFIQFLNESVQDISDSIIDAAIEIELSPTQFVHTIKGNAVSIEFGSNVKTETVSKLAKEIEKLGLNVKAHRGGLSIYESVAETIPEIEQNWSKIRDSYITSRIVKVNNGLSYLKGKILKATIEVTNKRIPLIHDSNSKWRYEIRIPTATINVESGFNSAEEAKKAALEWAEQSLT